MRRCILVAAALVAVVLTAGGCPPSGPPAPDSCNDPSSSGVTALQIGPGVDSSGGAATGGFQPYHDGQAAELAFGGQGFSMLPVRLFASGPNPPPCLEQVTVVCTDPGCSGGALVDNSVGLRTYPDSGGRATRPLYLVLGNGEQPSLVVKSTVGGVQAMVRLGPAILDLSLPTARDMTSD